MFERILVPLDSSKLADVVLPYAEELAIAFKSELSLMYVCELAEEKFHRIHEFYLGKIAELVKREIREKHPRKGRVSIEVKSVVVRGKPAEEICNYANNNDINLIVIATHGRLGIMRRLMGQIADKVFQATQVPLLLVTTTKPGLKLYPGQVLNRILLPLDGTERGEAALPYVNELIRRLGAQVTILRVISPAQRVHTVGGLNYVRFPDQEIESMKASALSYLEKVAKKLSATRTALLREVRVGDDTAKEIIRCADEVNARLIVITTARTAGIGRRISGSKTQKVLQATNLPVLLLRMRGLQA